MVGDVREHSLGQLEHLFASDPTLSFLRERGPAACLGFLEKPEAEDLASRRYVNECHLCIDLFKDARRAGEILRGIEKGFREELQPALAALGVPDGPAEIPGLE